MPKSISITPPAPPIEFVEMEAPEIRDYSDGLPDEVIGTDGHQYNLRPGPDGTLKVPFQAVESAERIGWNII